MALSTKLFGKWEFEGVEVRDPGLRRYISIGPIASPHSKGTHEHRRFRKSDLSIIDRLIGKVMLGGGRSSGKKTKATSVVRNSFELVGLKTKRNPIQVLVDAIENSAPCEDTTRVSHGGAVYFLAVDVSPQRRVDLALRFITEGARKKGFKNRQALEEALARELIAAANNDSNRSYAVQKRNEIERIALASR